MESSTCTLGLALILGVLIGALFVGGGAQYRSAMTKIKAVETERKKYEEALTKAKQKRSEGYGDLVAAALLILVSIALLIVAIQIVSGGQLL